jgi:hypothetical protein
MVHIAHRLLGRPKSNHVAAAIIQFCGELLQQVAHRTALPKARCFRHP